MNHAVRHSIGVTLLALVTVAVTPLEVREIVHLLDGSAVEGAIVERIPGVSYSVETRRGEVVTLPAAQVNSIEKLAVNPDDAAFSYRDVVVLHSGLIFRGAIVEEVPEQHIVLLADGGLSLRFRMDAIWRIASEKCAAGQSRAAIGEHPTGGDLRRAFRIELTINRVESAEASGDDEQSGRLEQLRDELADLEAERDAADDLREEGEQSITRLRGQLADLEGEASDLAAELAQRALPCAAENPEAQAAILTAYELVQDHLGDLHTTALGRTQVDPRLLTEQVALEREMRHVELTSLLTLPLPMGSLDPAVASLVAIFSQEERNELYRELRLRPTLRPSFLNALLPMGVGSFKQGDYLGGAISALSIIGGLVLTLDAASYAGANVDDPDYTAPVRMWIGLGMASGGYLYSLGAPRIYRMRQNARLEDALRPDEALGESE